MLCSAAKDVVRLVLDSAPEILTKQMSTECAAPGAADSFECEGHIVAQDGEADWTQASPLAEEGDLFCPP